MSPGGFNCDCENECESIGNKMRVLLCCVPYGRDNIGDEAILESIVKILRSISSDLEITVSTDEPQITAKSLGVRTCALFGFDDPLWDLDELEFELGRADIIIWGGATGLSDYPEHAVQILEMAQARGKKTAVFCTGMNDCLNPFLYRIRPGIKRDISEFIKLFSFGFVDFAGRIEAGKISQAHARIVDVIDKADAVIVRDVETSENLRNIGVTRESIHVACDPAITLEPTPGDKARFKSFYHDDPQNRIPRRRVGICLSSQSPVKKMSRLASVLDEIVEKFNVDLYMIPMNPLTDRAYMTRIRMSMRQRNHFHEYPGGENPTTVAAYAGTMDLIISSRLHLLILGSISHVPLIGISRGSKVDSFIGQFGLVATGSVDNPDYEFLLSEVERLLDDSSRMLYVRHSMNVVQDMKKRLQRGVEILGRLFGVISLPAWDLNSGENLSDNSGLVSRADEALIESLIRD